MGLSGNTGFQYELAVAVHLRRRWGVAGPLSQAIEADLERDLRRPGVESLIGHLDSTDLAEALRRRLALGAVEDIELIGQDDDTPGDLLIHTGRKRTLEASVSVKYQTRVSRNPTGRLFVPEEFVQRMERELVAETIPAYVAEMTARFGEPANWFRKRRTSRAASEFIARIVGEVCRTWESLPPYRRRRIVQECLQYGARVAYLTVVLARDGRSWSIEESAGEHHLMDVERVLLAPAAGASQYVRFVHAGVGAIAQMQVKFNNGIVEPCRGARGPGALRLADGTPCRPGRPFNSWNFEVTGGTP